MNFAMHQATEDLELSEFSDAHFETRHGRRWLATIAGAILIVLAGLLAADRLFHPSRFQIEDIEVHGEFLNVDGEQVRRVTQSVLSGNYFSVDLERLEQSITDLPWVFSASLRRKWPSTIVVEVEEVKPVAEWGRDQWLNVTGDLVERQTRISLEIASGLPRLFGPEREKDTVWGAFQRWSEKFASVGLDLKELVLDSRGLWHIRLSLSALAMDNSQPATDGLLLDVGSREVTMIVDRGNALEKTDRFIKALNQELIDKFPLMERIDLRYPNGFAVSWVADDFGEGLEKAVTGNNISQVTSLEN